MGVLRNDFGTLLRKRPEGFVWLVFCYGMLNTLLHYASLLAAYFSLPRSARGLEGNT